MKRSPPYWLSRAPRPCLQDGKAREGKGRFERLEISPPNRDFPRFIAVVKTEKHGERKIENISIAENNNGRSRAPAREPCCAYST